MKKTNRNSGKWIFRVLFICAIGSVMAFFVSDVWAAQIKRVQRGVVNFDTDDVVQSVTFTYPVDQSKSIILVTGIAGAAATNNDQNWFFTGQFESNDTIAIDRAGANLPASVYWQVIEFADGVSVQRGISSMPSPPPAGLPQSKDITLPVALTDLKNNATGVPTPDGIPDCSVPIIQVRAALTTRTQTHEVFLLPSFTDTGTLRVTRNAGTGTKALQIVWQIIDFLTDGSLQTGTADIGIGNGEVNADPNKYTDVVINAVANPLLFTYFSPGNSTAGVDSRLYTTGEVLDPTHLRFARWYASGTANTNVGIRYYVVDLTGSSNFSQTGSEAWATAPAGRIGVNDATNATPIQITTASNHGLAVNDRVNISGVTGNTAANGTWLVKTVPSATTFTLMTDSGADSVGNAAYSTSATDWMQKAILATGFTTVDPARTMVVSLVREQDYPASNFDRYADENTIGAEILGNGSLATMRAGSVSTGAAAKIAFNAVEFSPLTLNEPNGVETGANSLVVGSPHSIKWAYAESRAGSAVKIKLDTNGSTSLSGNYTTTIYTTANVTDAAKYTACSNNTCTFTWKPGQDGQVSASDDVIGTQLRVAVIDTGLNAAEDGSARNYDISNADFTMRGSISNVHLEKNSQTVSQVNIEATDIYVKWSHTGSIGDVKIELDNTGDGTYESELIASTLGTADSWLWPSVPNAVSLTAKIRVKELAATDPTDQVAGISGPFEIRPGLTLNKPLSSDSYLTGVTYRLEWTPTGDVGDVNLTYSVGGSNFAAPPGITNPITGYTGGACPVGKTCYDWTVAPATLRGATKLQLVKSDNANVKAFETGSEGTGSGPNTTFTIYGSISIDLPPTTDIFRTLQNTDITMSLPGGAGSVGATSGFTFKYCTNYSNPTPTWVIMANPTSGDGVNAGGSTPYTYTWNVRDIIGDDVGIRVEEKGPNSETIYATKGPYKVRGYIGVTSPTVASVLKVGETYTIQWSASGSIGQVYIDMDRNGLGTYSVPIVGPTAPAKFEKVGVDCNPLTVDASAQSFIWGKNTYYTEGTCTTPAGPVPAETCDPCNIKVYKTTESNPLTGAADVSDNFKLKNKISNVRVTQSPPYNINQTIEIKWDPQPYDSNWGTAGLQYSTDGNTWVPFSNENGVANSGENDVSEAPWGGSTTYLWKIPNENLISSSVRIRVGVSSDTGTPKDLCLDGVCSDSGQFAVRGSIVLEAQGQADGGTGDGNIIWELGTGNKQIKWDVVGNLGQVDLSYSINGGGFTNPITSVTCGSSGTYTYNWPIPDNVIGNLESASIKIKVATPDDSVSDTSTYNITVNSKLTLSSFPAYVEVDNPDDTADYYNITWTKTGYIDKVQLFYDTNSGGGTDNDPQTEADNYLNPITIQLGDGSTSFNPQLSAAAGGTNWVIPNAIGNTVRMRVRSVANPTLRSDLTSDFQIKGKIVILAPTIATKDASAWLIDGGVGTVLDKTQTIRWRNCGTLGDVRIKFSANGSAFAELPNQPIANNGENGIKTYTWRIPAVWETKDTNTTENYLKIEDASISKQSDKFEIKGQLRIKVPGFTGGEIYDIGELGASVPIEWYYAGNLGTINIWYSPDHGLNYGALPKATIPVNTVQPYDLIVSNANTVEGRIKIQQDTDTTYVSTESGDSAPPGYYFSLRGSLFLDSPVNEPTEWKVDSPDKNKIMWHSVGVPPAADVAIDLDTNSGLDNYPISIIGATPNDGEYIWVIPPAKYVEVTSSLDPASLSDKCKIRIRYSGISNAAPPTTFKIRPSLNLIAPIDNSVPAEVGSPITIKWDLPLGNVPFVKIRISTDGSTWPDANPPTSAAKGGIIASSVDSTQGPTGYSAWNVTDIMTNTAKVRIEKSNDPLITAPLGGFFYVKGTVTNVHVKNNAGDPPPPSPIDLPAYATKYITWSSTGSLGTVTGFYSTNADSVTPPPTWNEITATCKDIPIGNGSCSWSIPAFPSAAVQVKLVSATSVDWQTITGLSPASPYNNIIGNISEVTAVADGDGTDMRVGGNKTIQWKASGYDVNSKFDILYRYDGGQWSVNPITGADGVVGTINGEYRTWQWTGIPNTISNDVDFMVKDHPPLNKSSAESSVNYIIKGNLSLLIPDDGTQAWNLGVDYTQDNVKGGRIQWQKNGSIGGLKIEFSASGTFTPADYTAGYVYTIESDYASGADGVNSYDWSAGLIGANRKISETARIKISNNTAIAGTELSDQSTSTFKIRPAITGFTSPVLDQVWNVGDAKNITWTANSGTDKDDFAPKVTIQYIIGGSPTTITGADNLDCVNGSNTFPWPNVADEKEESVTVKVSFNTHSTVNNLSSSAFKIRPKINVTSPILDQPFTVGQVYNNAIKWNITNNGITSVKVPTVKVLLDYSNGGGGYPVTLSPSELIANGAAGIAFNVLDSYTLGANAMIKVLDTDAGYPNVYGESARFELRGGLILSAPTGAATSLTADTTYTNAISWTFKGNISQVKAYYDLDSRNGDQWVAVLPVSIKAQAGTSGASSLDWAVPSSVTNWTRVRIMDGNEADVNNCVVCATSAADFKIGGEFDVTAPENGTPIYAEDTATHITWTPVKGAGISKVHLYYSNNCDVSSYNDCTWIRITPETGDDLTSGTDNDGDYTWTPVPRALADLSTTSHRVMVTQRVPANEDKTYNIGSGIIFPIYSKLTVVTPDTNTEWSLGDLDKNILFTKKGDVQSVDIRYYYDYAGDPATYITVSTGLDVSDATGGVNHNGQYYFFPWDIDPATSVSIAKSAKVEVRVNSPGVQENASTRDQSDGFMVKGSISDISVVADGTPATTDMEVTGSKVIKWKPYGDISTFKIEYRIDGLGWTQLCDAGTGLACAGAAGQIAGADAGAGYKSYTWNNIPNSISNDVDFKVSDYNIPDKVFAESPDLAVPASSYKIKGKLSLLIPDDGTQAWNLGVDYTQDNVKGGRIQWQKNGSIGGLKIEFSASGTFTPADYTAGYVYTIENDYASGADGVNSYDWSAGLIGANRKISETARIKISNNTAIAGTELSDQSTSTFKIRPVITGFSSPLLDQVWNVGDAKNIIWTANSGTDKDGFAPKVTVQYLIGGSPTTITGADNLDCVNGSNTFPWPNVADEKEESVTVKVSFNTHSTVNNLSSSAFKIRPKINVTSPILNEPFTVGQVYNNAIKWNITNNGITSVKVPTVKVLLDYSNGGGGYPVTLSGSELIANGAAGIAFNVLDSYTLGANAKIKVLDTDAGYPNVYGESARFELRGGLILGAPTGAATSLTADTTYTNAISWTFKGNISQVKAYYDLDSRNGDQWVAVLPVSIKAQAGTSGASSLDWAVPSSVTNWARVRIMDGNEADVNNCVVCATSAADFKIGGEFNITAPENGTPVYAEDTATHLTWTPVKGAGITKVHLYYSNNCDVSSYNDCTWIRITPETGDDLTSGTDNDGDYTWTPVPRALADLSTTSHRVMVTQRVPANEDKTYNIGSGITFPIYSKLTVVTPDTSTEWGLGDQNKNIQFSKKGDIQSVDIRYYYDYAGDPASYLTISTGLDVSDATGAVNYDGQYYFFPWDIDPATNVSIAKSAKIEVRVNSPGIQENASTRDQSDGFMIKGSISDISVVTDGTPASTDMEVTGSKTLRWKPYGNISKYKVRYRVDNGLWQEITPAGGVNGDADPLNDPAFRAWTWNNIPNTISNNVDFEVSDYNASDKVLNFSSVDYIIKGKLILLIPDDGTQAWNLGVDYTQDNVKGGRIQWQKNGAIGGLKIEFSASGTFTPADYTAGYVYTIENDYASGADGVNSYDWSAGLIGANRKISETARIKISNNTIITGTELSDQSTSTFKIRPVITGFSSPLLDQVWNVGDAKNIIWTANSGTDKDGFAPKITVQYLIGGSPTTITGADNLDCVNGSNTFPWPNVADEKEESVTLKVSFNTHSTVNNLSSSSFKIRPKINVTSPILDQPFTVGQVYNNAIKWNVTNNGITSAKVPTVKVLLDYNNGSGGYPVTLSGSELIANGAAGIAFNVLDSYTLGANVMIKVLDTDAGYPNVYGESARFELRGGLTLGAPSGAATSLTADTTYTNAISWTFKGNISQVKAYYDLDSRNGDQWVAVLPVSIKAQAGTSGASSLDWAVPSSVTNWARVRIMDGNEADVNNCVVCATSAADFKIGGEFDVTAPENGTPVYAEDTATHITWTPVKGAGISKVHLYYSNNCDVSSYNDCTWIRITPETGVDGTSGTDNDGDYTWTPVPRALADLSTTSHRVMVTQRAPANEDKTYNIGSGITFPIYSKLTVVTPDTSTEWGLGELDKNIQFSKKGDVQSVDIRYYYNYAGDPATYLTISTGLDVSDATGGVNHNGQYYFFPWDVDPVATNVSIAKSAKIEVRVNSPGIQENASTRDQSDGFMIKGSISDVSVVADGTPATTDMEVTGSKVIKWKPYGDIATFKIEYRIDAGLWTQLCDAGTGVACAGAPGQISGTDAGGGYKSYTWNNIPNSISNDVDFKVSDYNIPDKVFAESPDLAVPASSYKIKGKLSLLIPDDGTQAWNLGVDYTQDNVKGGRIQWQKNGSIGGLKIEFSASGTFTPADYTAGYVYTIESDYASGADGVNSYDWSAGIIGVNRKISETARIKISNNTIITGTELSDQSTSTFKIRPVITGFSSPLLDQVWNVGDAKNIIWTANSGTDKDGSAPKVTLQYIIGGSPTTITGADNLDCVNGSNTFPWPNVADEKEESVTVKVSFNTHSTVNNLTSSSFKIRPKINVTSPILNQPFIVGQVYNNTIKWNVTNNGITSVKVPTVKVLLDYSNGSGGYPVTLSPSELIANGAAGIAFNVLDSYTLGANAMIKVLDTDVAYPNVYGESERFELRGGLILSAPTGAATSLTADTTYTNAISWTFKGNISQVKAYYDLDSRNGDQWVEVLPVSIKAQAGTSGASSLDWQVPSSVSNWARVRIMDANEADVNTCVVCATSAADFKIGGEFNITAPENGTPVYAEDTATHITWTPVKGAGISKVHLYYSNNCDVSSYNDCTWIRITPETGDDLTSGTDNDGDYTWTPVPRALADLSTTSHRVMVTQRVPANEDKTYNIGSGIIFPIYSKLTVVTPDTNTEWSLGEQDKNILFTKKGDVQSVDIRYYYDYAGDPATYLTVSTGLDVSDATGGVNHNGQYYFFPWDIDPATNISIAKSAKVEVRVNSPGIQENASTRDQSDGFMIKGSISDISVVADGAPATTDMEVTGSKVIKWKPYGDIPIFKIEYRVDAGIWTQICDAGTGAACAGNPGKITGIDAGGGYKSYTWNNVPNSISNDVDFKVSDYNIPDKVSAESPDLAVPANSYKIKGKLSLLIPDDGTQAWNLGVDYTQDNVKGGRIQWQKNGSIGGLKIEFSASGTFTPADYTAGYVYTIESDYASGADGVNSYDWSAGLIGANRKISETARIKISNNTIITGTELSDQSTSTFKIRPAVTGITSPTLDEIWNVGNPKNIIWTANSGTDKDGFAPKVTLQYIIAGSPTTITGADNLDCVNGNNTFPVPNVPDEKSEDVTLKVSFNTHSTVNNLISSSFKIRPEITLDPSINANTKLIALSSNNLIKWTCTGTKIANVNVRYDLYGGTGPDLDPNTPADNFQGVIKNNAAGNEGILGVAWNNIPDVDNNVKIKIVDVDSSNINVVSEEFDIIGKIVFDVNTIPQANPKEKWGIGSQHTIRWSTQGTVDTVRLSYSTDGGVIYNPIGESPGNLGAEGILWTIANIQGIVSPTVTLKIYQPTYPDDVEDISPEFSIVPTYTITQPANDGQGNAAEITANGDYEIKWDRLGANPYVKLYYDYNANSVNIFSVPPGTPIESTEVAVNISSSADGTPINITTSIPHGFTTGDNLDISGHSIAYINNTWTVTVTGATTFTLNNSVAQGVGNGTGGTAGGQNMINNDGSFIWHAPDIVDTVNHSSNYVRVRVVYSIDDEVDDKSDIFRIVPGFEVVTPNISADQADVGQPYTIKWKCTSVNVPQVRIYYSVTGGQNDDYANKEITTGPNYADNTGAANAQRSYVWQEVQNDITDKFKVKIVDLDNATTAAYDVSNSNAKIKAYFKMLSPNGDPDGNEVFTVNQPYVIRWNWNGSVTKVKLDYCKNDDWNNAVTITSSTDNDGVFGDTQAEPFVMPDFISDTVKFRVKAADPFDPDAKDSSDYYLKIKGVFSDLSAVGGGAGHINGRLDIGYPAALQWTTVGGSNALGGRSLNTVDIVAYSNMGLADPGFPYASDNPYLIKTNYANVANGTTTYSWDHDDTSNVAGVPDMASDNVVIRVRDSVDNNVKLDFSVKLIGSFRVTQPDNEAEPWVVDAAKEIKWNPTGNSIQNAKISYSTVGNSADPDDWHPIKENDGTVDDGVVANDGLVPWTVPDDVSSHCVIKIEDPNDDTVSDVSDNEFEIYGNFTFTNPPSGTVERWVTNETSHTITWISNASTVTKVNLYYFKNGDTSVMTPIAANYNNIKGTNIKAWTIPDDRANTVQIRIEDANLGTYNAGQGTFKAGTYKDSTPFKIDYYNISWNARDVLTNLPITGGLTVNCTSGWIGSGLSSAVPIVHPTPYGSWSAAWTHKDYGDYGANYTADRDQTLEIFLESKVVHVWEAKTEYVYDKLNDRLTFNSTLIRDGSVVTGAKNCSIEIFNPSAPDTILKSLSDTTADTMGFFSMIWNSTGLDTSKVYNARTVIENVLGGVFKTPFLINMVPTVSLYDMQAKVNSVLDKPISQVNTELQASLASQTSLINAKMTEQTGIIVTKTNEMRSAVETSLSSFETRSNVALVKLQAGADQAVAAGEQAASAAGELEATAKKYSWNASVSPNPALVGDMITLQCQGQPGLGPILNIYSWDNKTIIREQYLKEVNSGLYTFEFPADGRFNPGKAYTYVVTESITGGLISGSGIVEAMSLTTIAGLASAAPAAESAAKKALEAIQNVEATLGSGENINISTTLKDLQDSVSSLPEAIAKEGPSARITAAVNEISDRLTTLIGKQGYDLGVLLEEALTESPTMKALRGKTDAINSVIEMLMQLFESKFGGADTPIVSTSLQPGSVKFRIAAINPSKTRAQKIQVKYYLPQEVVPKDILELSGLSLEYDSEKSTYYAYKYDVELEPAEVRSFEVHVEDIWLVPEAQISDLRKRTDTALDRLSKTEYYTKVKEIADTIYSRLDEIVRLQLDDSVSRQQHIGYYRQNVATIKQILEDIAKMEKLLVTAGGPQSPEMLHNAKVKSDSPTKTMTWIIIFIIITFTGLLAGVLFFTWHRQAGLNKEAMSQAKKSAFPGDNSETKPNESQK